MADEIIRKVALEHVAAFLADREDLDRLAFALELERMVLCETRDVTVEAPAEAPFGCQHHQQLHLIAARSGQQFRRAVAFANRRRELCHHGVEPFGIGTRVLGSFLGAAQFCCRDHLHRLGDLAGRLDRLDPVFKVLEIWHCPISP